MKGCVFVTGGGGYIGSHACKLLALSGYTPVAVDNLATGWQEAVKFGPFEQVDLLDREALDAAFSRYAPEAVMHFAAFSDVGESARDPAKYWHNNVTGALTLLEAMRAADCGSLVFSSTCAVYGNADGVLLNEEAPIRPLNAYGASKAAIEAMIADYAAAHGLSATVFRYFNVAGADPEGEVGEFHRPETHLVPRILDAIAGAMPSLSIYGTDYDTPDGTCVRDYIHVTDLVEAHLLGLQSAPGPGGVRTYNLGTGRGFSVHEVIEAAMAVTGRDATIVEGPRRPGDAVSLVSGSTRAEAELGWTPKRSEVETMIEDAWRWHQGAGYSS